MSAWYTIDRYECNTSPQFDAIGRRSWYDISKDTLYRSRMFYYIQSLLKDRKTDIGVIPVCVADVLSETRTNLTELRGTYDTLHRSAAHVLHSTPRKKYTPDRQDTRHVADILWVTRTQHPVWHHTTQGQQQEDSIQFTGGAT